MKSKYLLLAALLAIILLAVFSAYMNKQKIKIEKNIATLEEKNRKLEDDFVKYNKQADFLKKEADSALLLANQYHEQFLEKEQDYKNIAWKCSYLWEIILSFRGVQSFRNYWIFAGDRFRRPTAQAGQFHGRGDGSGIEVELIWCIQ